MDKEFREAQPAGYVSGSPVVAETLAGARTYGGLGQQGCACLPT